MPRFSLWLLLCALPAAALPQSTTTTTTVTQVSGIPVYGAVLTFEAAVNALMGNMTIIVDGQPTTTSAVDSAGRVFTNLSFSAGTHTVGASYAADGIYLSSTATPLTVVVGKASTSVLMSGSSAQTGQPVTITALVGITNPASGSAGGTVAFLWGATPISGCGAAPVQKGAATCTANAPSPGPIVVNGQYSGDANTAASANTLSLSIGQVVASVYLAAAPNSPVWGTEVTVNALVLGAQNVAAPTGTVTFSNGGKTSAPQTMGANGYASLAASYATGSYGFSAVYNGDANYQASAAVSLNLTVAKAPTVLVVSSDPAQIDQPVTLRASVSLASGTGSMAGTVDFTIGGKAVSGCTGVSISAASSGGSATCQTTFAQFGAFTLGGSFSGDANTLPSTASAAVTVNKAAPAIYLTATPVAPVYGVPVTLGALVLGAQVIAAPTGFVNFADGSTQFPSQSLSADGHALSTSPLTVGTHAITAAYSGDAFYQSSAVSLNLIVGKAPAVLVVSSDPAATGQPVTLRASVSLASGTGPISGIVNFTIGGIAVSGCTGISISSGTSNGGSAACQTTLTQIGALTLGGSFSGDANTLPSTASAAVTVNKAAPGINLTATPAAPVYGVPVTLGALVLGAQGISAPTGSVTFADGAVQFPSQPLSADGHAASTSLLTVGTHAITAVYSGDANYQASAPASLNLIVGKAPTVLLVSSDPAATGQPLTLRASVSLASGTGAITGTVNFTLGGKAVSGCTGISISSGSAACQTTLTQLGAFTLGGSFSGDANTLPSTASAAVAVNKAAPGIYLAAAPVAAVYGVPVTLNALILGAAGVAAPTGTVVFSETGTVYGSQPVAAGGASFVALLTAGTHGITAVYSGDANYQAATSSPVGVTVAKAGTATSLTALIGGTFTAMVAVTPPGAGSPTGAVQFRNATAVVGTAPLLAQGSAFIAILAGAAATGSITASYAGDANFLASASSAVIVTPPQTQVALTSSLNPSAAGQTVTFTAAVSMTPRPTAAAPTGAVTLSADGVVLGAANLSGGQTAFGATLGAGSHTVTASYSGDASYGAATGTITQVVGKAATSLTVTSSAPLAIYGQSVTLTALLGPQTSAASPAGSVQFTDSAATLGSAQTTGGAASLSVNLAPGVHAIAASWPGDGTWGAASAQFSETVNKASTTTTLAISGGMMLAAVTVAAPGAGSPSGSVRFLDAAANTVLATVVLSGASASAALPAAANAVVAAYSGDGNFLGSNSATLTLLSATNAASYLSGGLAPDEIVTLFGPGLATVTASAPGAPVDSLAGAAVKVTDSAGAVRTAQLFFVSPAQAAILMPAGVALGPATLTVVNASRALSALITVTNVAPGLFTADNSGQGAPAAQVITVHADGTQDDPQPATSPIDLSDPAANVYLVLYGTGIRHAAAAPICTIALQPVTVLFAGAQGVLPGLDQVNVLLPQSLKGSGTVPLTLTVDGQAANTVTLSFR